MATLTEHCEAQLHALEGQHLRRVLRVSARADDSGVEVEQDGRTYVSFACNDYLGLRNHPAVIAAGAQALAEHGAGAGASRLITGNHPLYAPLEAKLAAMKQTDAALVFGSGYLTNLGVIPALVGKGDVIFADKLVHACIIDAAQLSGARLVRFRHNDMVHLEALLKGYRPPPNLPPQAGGGIGGGNALIVTDHVFSMDGDVAPIAEIAALGRQYDAWTMADDAHGLGIIDRHPGESRGLGPQGETSHEALDPGFRRDDIDIWMGTLSKSAGAYGGYVCGSQALIDYLVTSARSFVFSTGLPPSACASALAALEVMEAEPERGSIAITLAQRVTKALGLPRAQSAIVPIILGEAEAALAASQKLKERGILATAIRPPTVPPGTARLRLAFSCEHTDAQVEGLIAALREVL
jgi:8-amino-7-oxononanoate synthase